MPSRSTLRLWLPVVIWTAMIFAASSASFSGGNTGNWLAKLIQLVLGHSVTPWQFHIIHAAVRKAAHLTEYGILGFLVFRAIRAGRRDWDFRWSLAAIAIAMAVACLDEWHQAFVPSRTASPYDVLIDTIGAALAQVLFFKT
jgi:VanZ family protein